MMERPAKRQKVSSNSLFQRPTRTLDLGNFQRPHHQRRSAGRKILPRVPDVTVTAAVLEVAVNDGSTTTQIAVPTSGVAVTLDSLGTLTLPALSTSISSTTSSSSSAISSSSTASASRGSISSAATTSRGSVSTSASSLGGTRSSSSSLSSSSFALSSSNQNITTSSTARTITVTATSTFHVSYENGTFIIPTATQQISSLSSSSDGQDTSKSYSYSSYVFGQDVTDTYLSYTTTTAPAGTGAASTAVFATNPGSLPSDISGATGGGGDNGSPAPVLTPEQTQMVGGIVGGVAGIALVLVVLLYVLRWYRQRLKQFGRLPEQLASSHSQDFGGSALIGSAAPMSQSRSSFFGSTAIGSNMKKLRPGSDMTTFTNTTSTTATESEKGFHRVSGRKIPPVLWTGGDQFGGSYGAFEKEINPDSQSRPFAARHNHDLSETSFYRDADGVHFGSGRPASRSAPSTPVYPSIFSSESARRPSLANVRNTSSRDFANDDLHKAFYKNMAKPDGLAEFRSSPARTPVIQSPSVSTFRLPIQAPVTMDEDIPEMPLPSPGLGLGLAPHRIPNGLSARSTNSGTGRFREQLA